MDTDSTWFSLNDIHPNNLPITTNPLPSKVDASKIKLPSDSEIAITTEGLLGGSYVSISPGGSDTFMKENEKFSYTQSSLSLNNLLQKFFSR